jgi:hypothetical protein
VGVICECVLPAQRPVLSWKFRIPSTPGNNIYDTFPIGTWPDTTPECLVRWVIKSRILLPNIVSTIVICAFPCIQKMHKLTCIEHKVPDNMEVQMPVQNGTNLIWNLLYVTTLVPRILEVVSRLLETCGHLLMYNWCSKHTDTEHTQICAE